MTRGGRGSLGVTEPVCAPIMCFVLCVFVCVCVKSTPRKNWSKRTGRQHHGVPVLVLTRAKYWTWRGELPGTRSVSVNRLAQHL